MLIHTSGSSVVRLLTVVALVVGSACTASSDLADERAESPAAQPPDSGTPNFTRNSGVSDAGDQQEPVPSTTEFDLEAQPSTPVIEPIPDTGVPGIDSSNAFCRAWSEFAGSFQALGITSALGDPAEAFRLEVIASSTVTTAVETMDANLPAELESERLVLIADFAGPFFSRAVVAESQLIAAGVDPDDLREVWLTGLIAAGVDDPNMEVGVPDTIDAEALDVAVASFDAAMDPIGSDPSLITAAEIPLTDEYLSATCPDGGILGGNDEIVTG